MNSTLRPRAAATVTLALLGLALLAAGCDRPMSSPVGHTTPPVSAHTYAWDRLVDQAGTALEKRHYAEAIALFESALSLRPDATVFALLGDCYWSQWKHGNHDPRLLERANAEYLKGLALDANHCGLNHATGRDLVLLNRHAEALPYLDTAKVCCLRQPLEAQNLWFRIQALVALRRADEAQIDFAEMEVRFASHRMTALAGRLLADTTQNAALRARYPEITDAAKK
jgi:tetratricopeptide (TPR) repeat protein